MSTMYKLWPFQDIVLTFAHTAVSSEAWAKLRDWAGVAGRGRLLLSGRVAHASLKTAVYSACSV